jgi:hypothetical protein
VRKKQQPKRPQKGKSILALASPEKNLIHHLHVLKMSNCFKLVDGKKLKILSKLLAFLLPLQLQQSPEGSVVRIRCLLCYD